MHGWKMWGRMGQKSREELWAEKGEARGTVASGVVWMPGLASPPNSVYLAKSSQEKLLKGELL